MKNSGASSGARAGGGLELRGRGVTQSETYGPDLEIPMNERGDYTSYEEQEFQRELLVNEIKIRLMLCSDIQNKLSRELYKYQKRLRAQPEEMQNRPEVQQDTS